MKPKHRIGLRRLLALRRDEKGLAAIEFAFIASILSLTILNVADFADYYFSRMQVNEAAEMGVQAAWTTCTPGPPSQLPATVGSNCPNLSTAVTNSVQSTSLGAHVTQIAGSPSEGWYCVNSSNALQLVSSDMTTKPADCTAAGMPGLEAADYITVTAQFSYAPLFPGITVAKAFTTPIIKTSLMRLH